MFNKPLNPQFCQTDVSRRLLKFRAWNEELNLMSKPFIFDHVLNFNDKHIKSITTEIIYQFTGLVDKKGVEIYEGDILNAGESVIEIEFKGRGFEGKYINISEEHEQSIKNNNYLQWLVIGNIHETFLIDIE